MNPKTETKTALFRRFNMHKKIPQKRCWNGFLSRLFFLFKLLHFFFLSFSFLYSDDLAFIWTNLCFIFCFSCDFFFFVILILFDYARLHVRRVNRFCKWMRFDFDLIFIYILFINLLEHLNVLFLELNV